MPPTCSAMHCVTCWTRACGAAAEGFVPDSRRQHQETSPMRPSSPLRRKAIATAGWLALASAPAFAQAPAVQKPQYGGELAEKWEMKQNPLRVEVQLRKGVMFPAKAGVMESREFVADDVVFSYDYLNKSPKKIPGYFDHVDKVEATGKHSVTFFLKQYNSEWDYRFGWGYYSGIIPKEGVTAGAA